MKCSRRRQGGVAGDSGRQKLSTNLYIQNVLACYATWPTVSRGSSNEEELRTGNWKQKQKRGETLNTNSIRIFYALRKCKGSRGRQLRQRQAAYAGKAQNKQHKLFRQATEPRQRERREERRGGGVQSSVAVSILAARRQSELEMSSQIGAARAAFMLHLCSPRNTLECKAKPDRGGQRERGLQQKLKKLHNEPELKVQQKRIITAYLMAHYELLCLVYQERWLLLLLLCVYNTLHVSSCRLAQGVYKAGASTVLVQSLLF